MDTLLSSTLYYFESKYAQNLKSTKLSRETLTSSYRDKNKRKFGFVNQDERLAYLLSRFPATYQACFEVFKNLPEIHISSSLDLGAGPGTASLAAASLFPALQKQICIEQDMGMVAIGKDIASLHHLPLSYITQNICSSALSESADLVILSYILGELDKEQQMKVIDKAWQATGKALVIISPGTSHLFQEFLSWREYLLNLGAHLYAPCPLSVSCPMANSNDWCHFKARINRTKTMRYLKSGTQSFEDEPYSYLIFTKEKFERPSARILTEPQKKSGHMNLTLCLGDKIEKKTVSKSHPLYKMLSKERAGAGLTEKL